MSFTRENWMRDMQTMFYQKTLKDIVLPGAHDAAMSKLTKNLGGANANNAITQHLSIYDMLMHGIRYFDLRAATYDNKTFYAIHASPFNTKTTLGTLDFGALGPSMDEILNDVKKFASTHPRELIILSFGHYYYLVDVPMTTADDSNKFDKNAFASYVQNILRDWMITTDRILDRNIFDDMGFGNVYGNIIARFDGVTSNPNSGIYSWDDVKISDNYAGTNDVGKMVKDQLDKMNDPKNHDGQLFLLSWTLTQSNLQAGIAGTSQYTDPVLETIFPVYGLSRLLGGHSVVQVPNLHELASMANAFLRPTMEYQVSAVPLKESSFAPQFAQGSAMYNQVIGGKAVISPAKGNVPNIILVDDADVWVTDIAIWMNYQFNRSYLTSTSSGGLGISSTTDSTQRLSLNYGDIIVLRNVNSMPHMYLSGRDNGAADVRLVEAYQDGNTYEHWKIVPHGSPYSWVQVGDVVALQNAHWNTYLVQLDNGVGTGIRSGSEGSLGPEAGWKLYGSGQDPRGNGNYLMFGDIIFLQSWRTGQGGTWLSCNQGILRTENNQRRMDADCKPNPDNWEQWAIAPLHGPYSGLP